MARRVTGSASLIGPAFVLDAQGLSLLADDRLDALVGPPTPFDDLAEAMPRLLNPPPGEVPPLCPLVTYDRLAAHPTGSRAG